MRKLSIIAFVAFIGALALWTLSPDPTFAQRGSASVRASAHVPGIVIGKTVFSEHNVALGTVENIVLNDSGCADYVIMSGRFAGAQGRFFPLPFSVIARTSPEAIFVRVDERILVSAPSFERNRFQVFASPEFQTKVKSFFQTNVQVTTPGAGAQSGTVRPEAAPKAQKQWQKPATEGTAPSGAKDREKALMERERKGKASEMGASDVSKQKQMDIRSKQQTLPKEGQMKHAPGTSEQGQRQMMMERGRSQMMMQKSPEKAGPAQGAAPAQAEQPGQKIK